MRGPLIVLLCWLLLSITGCAGRNHFPVLDLPATGEERRILVTFVDRNIGRELSANPVDAFGPVDSMRIPHGASGWPRIWPGAMDYA